MPPVSCLAWIGLVAGVVLPVVAAEKRARPPKFDKKAFIGVFYPDLTKVVPTDRPTASELRGVPAPTAASPSSGKPIPSASTSVSQTPTETNGWSAIISPNSLEDEVKRIKLHYDSVVTTPGVFRGTGYVQARLDLSILATLFAVITQYDGDVRWKKESAVTRDLMARTAANAKVGSVQVYNEAKLRKADLQDLLAGSGISSNRPAAEDVTWPDIVGRGPLMQYLEELLQESLQPLSRSKKEVDTNSDELRRYAELVAVVSRVLLKEDMEEADDEDYQQWSTSMEEAALRVRQALEEKDADAVRKAVGAVSQTCVQCHETFR